MTQDLDDARLKEILVSLGYSPDGMTEEEIADFFQPRVTMVRYQGDWPSAQEEELYVRAGVGFYEKDGRFSFTYSYPPELKDAAAYEELRSQGLVNDRGLPRNPKTGFEPGGEAR